MSTHKYFYYSTFYVHINIFCSNNFFLQILPCHNFWADLRIPTNEIPYENLNDHDELQIRKS